MEHWRRVHQRDLHQHWHCGVAFRIVTFGYGGFGGQIKAANGTGLYLGNGGLLSGSFTAGEGAEVDLYGGTFTQGGSLAFSGAGSYLMTGSATLTLLNDVVPNLQMEGGSIYTEPAFQGGSITNLVLSGLSLNTSNLITGSLTVYGSINAPLVVASNATLTWDGQVNAQITAQPGATLNWRGNRLYTPLYIPSNAVLNITGPDNPQAFNWLTNAGTMNWTGGNFTVGGCGWGIYNLAGATFNIECDTTLSWWCGSEFVNNAGLIRKLSSVNSGSTGTTYWYPLLYNTGVVDVEQGALVFQDYATNSVTGVYQCESNAALYFNGGTIFSGT